MSGDEPFVEKDLAQTSDTIVRVATQEKFIGQMVEAMKYFFGKGDDSFSDHFPNRKDTNNFPFKGFILEGPPGSGKTEAVIEAGRRLWSDLGNQHGINVRLFHVNSANINRSRVGEMESRLKQVFTSAQNTMDDYTRTIILFDDIETLLVKRDDSRSQEWSRSLNGVFFHELDNLVTTKTMVIATTNISEMVDPAVRSRLAFREAPAPTADEMKEVARTALPIRGTKGMTQEQLLEITAKAIDEHLAAGEPPSFRLARQTAIETLLDSVAGWGKEAN
jgi:SpoVK/Ycf46/Vps4 family AAA+-type ATPase